VLFSEFACITGELEGLNVHSLNLVLPLNKLLGKQFVIPHNSLGFSGGNFQQFGNRVYNRMRPAPVAIVVPSINIKPKMKTMTSGTMGTLAVHPTMPEMTVSLRCGLYPIISIKLFYAHKVATLSNVLITKFIQLL
jgi:hypothetical protein